jgi:DHA1 family bicyclomycin/chloramphenicol resistance-like MFS transporter
MTTPDTAPRHMLRTMAVLCALMGFASISTDFYLPAMPTMSRALGVGPGAMELTISAYLVGFSLGQLIWGPIGDRYGRKRPIGIGLVLFIIGSAGCAQADSVQAVIGWRVVQASGACAGVVLSRAMVRDVFGPEKSGQMLSTLITVMAIAPLIGPFLGGQVLALWGWRAIFWLLVGVGVLTGLGLASIPETLPLAHRASDRLSNALGDYLTLLRDRRVLSCALVGGTYYLGVYAYVAGTPFAFITYHHLAPQLFGVVFGLGIVGIMGANMVNVRMLRRWGPPRLIRLGAAAAGLSGTALLVCAWSGWGGMVGLAAACFVFVAASGLMVANSMALAMRHLPRQAGAVSALLGAAQYGSGMAGAGLVSLFANGTPVPMAAIIAVSGATCALSAWAVIG